MLQQSEFLKLCTCFVLIRSDGTIGWLSVYSLGLRRLCETTCKRFDTIRTHEGGSVQHCPLLVIDGGHVLGVGLELPVELGGASSKDALQERRLQSWFKELKF